MGELLASIIGALSAGALAKAGDIGGRAVTDAYDGLRALIVRKIGKGGAVQSVEDARSEAAQAALAEALAKAGVAADENWRSTPRRFVRRSQAPRGRVVRILRWAILSAR